MIDFKEFKIENKLFEQVYNKWCKLVDIKNHNRNTFKLFIKDCLIELFKDLEDDTKSFQYELTYPTLFSFYSNCKKSNKEFVIEIEKDIVYLYLNEVCYLRFINTVSSKLGTDEIRDMLWEINIKLDEITNRNKD